MRVRKSELKTGPLQAGIVLLFQIHLLDELKKDPGTGMIRKSVLCYQSGVRKHQGEEDRKVWGRQCLRVCVCVND